MRNSVSPPSADALVGLSHSVTTARLLSGVVHEVNNALLVISGTVELLEARNDLPEPAVRALERLRRQSSRAAAALAEVLAFTRAPVDQRENVDLRDVARAAVELRRFAVTRAGLSIELEPPASARCEVRGNRGALQQAILNLIMHEEQALEGTGGRITIDVRTSSERATVRVSGGGRQGLARREAMFEPFAAAGASSDTSGLGLFAARVIAEAHEGALEVDEDPAAFVLRLPPLPAV